MVFTKVDTKQRNLSPSTLFAWKENYLKELSKKRLDEDQEVKELPPKKQGRTLLLETELDTKVQLYVKHLRTNGAVIINTVIVMATVEGIVHRLVCYFAPMSRIGVDSKEYYLGPIMVFVL